MTELSPYVAGGLTRMSRRAQRELERREAENRLELARISHAAELQAERVTAVAYVGKRAEHEVAMLSQLEVQLAQLVPAATTRLQAIGDLTALGMAEVVGETVRRVK